MAKYTLLKTTINLKIADRLRAGGLCIYSSYLADGRDIYQALHAHAADKSLGCVSRKATQVVNISVDPHVEEGSFVERCIGQSV